MSLGSRYQPLKFQELLEKLPVPVFVVDGEYKMRGANHKALDLLICKPEEVVGKLPGIVFQCAHAGLPGGCGRTVQCSGCAIRASVTHTFATGEALCEVRTTIQRGEPGAVEPVTFRISTEKMGDVVLLQVDKLCS